MSQITMGKSAPNRFEQSVRKNTDKNFEQVFVLNIEMRQLMIGDGQILGDSQHADQRSSQCVVVIRVDFWQDFQVYPGSRENADHLTRAEAGLGSSC